ncbi:recombinase family protein [Serinicoccus marinus]|uniref:recombinase family protein n=1 Tax=Serinicoccus marinus TaxID=247333 RepID=UPI0024933027|nr:recombinase family protein [Serinicoccus marinus]
MNPTPAAVYARISVSNEASVSLARQVEAARQYAAARGWEVVDTFTDDGVSATHNRPEDREGWRAVLDSPARFEKVIVWKVDRLARRVLDFLHADEALQARGAGIVAVDDPVDMTTPQGRGFAVMLAVFGEMEAAVTSARVAAARSHLVRAGRVVGGKVPYGWRSVENPRGPGKVLAQDPDRIGYVRGAVERVQAGQSVYAAMQWLNEVGAPTPAGRGDAWVYSSVERMLRHPVLAGLTPFNPGNGARRRGADVLRDERGLPVVDEAVALLPVAEWRALVDALDGRTSAQALPRALKGTTSALLSGLVWCGEHDEPVRMHRGTRAGRESYSCPACHQTVSGFEQVVVEEFLAAKGEHLRWRTVRVVHEGGAALLPEIEARLDELDALIRQAPDREARAALQEQQGTLLDLRDDKRAQTPEVRVEAEGTDRTFGEDWEAAATTAERRAVLDSGLARVTVTRGGRGRRTRDQLLARLAFDWRPTPEWHEPDETWLAHDTDDEALEMLHAIDPEEAAGLRALRQARQRARGEF